MTPNSFEWTTPPGPSTPQVQDPLAGRTAGRWRDAADGEGQHSCAPLIRRASIGAARARAGAGLRPAARRRAPVRRLDACGGDVGPARRRALRPRQRRGHGGAVYQLAWSGDARLLASGSKDSTVKVWEMRKVD
mgnify:CR=1 FL=1